MALSTAPPRLYAGTLEAGRRLDGGFLAARPDAAAARWTASPDETVDHV